MLIRFSLQGFMIHTHSADLSNHFQDKILEYLFLHMHIYICQRFRFGLKQFLHGIVKPNCVAHILSIDIG